jgi:hypothetical protein
MICLIWNGKRHYCEQKLGKKMNWATYVEWTNVEQQRRKSCLSSAETNYLLSDDEGGNSKDGMEHEDFRIQAI